MRKILLGLTILIFQMGCVTFKFDFIIETDEKSVTEQFHEILDEQWEKGMVNSPEWATRLGDNRFNDQLNDVSYETILKRQRKTKVLLEKVKSIDRSK